MSFLRIKIYMTDMKRVLFCLLSALVLSVAFTACSDDDDNHDYRVDIQKVKDTVPGNWTVSHIEFRQEEGSMSTNTKLLNASLSFNDGTYTVTTADDEDYDEGTYQISPYKFVFTHTDETKDTLDIIDVNRDNYQTIRLKQKVTKKNSIVYTLEKVHLYTD